MHQNTVWDMSGTRLTCPNICDTVSKQVFLALFTCPTCPTLFILIGTGQRLSIILGHVLGHVGQVGHVKTLFSALFNISPFYNTPHMWDFGSGGRVDTKKPANFPQDTGVTT